MDNRLGEIEFKSAKPEDALALVDFHNSYYGHNRKPEHWLWEYQTYEPSKAVFIFSKDREKIVATQGFIPIYLQVANECVPSSKIENSLCMSQYRGNNGFQGATLYKRQLEYTERKLIERGITFWWGIGHPKVLETQGVNNISEIEVVSRPGNRWLDLIINLLEQRPLWRRIAFTARALLRSFLVRNIRTIPEIQTKAGYEIKKGRIPEEDIKQLYQRMTAKYKNTVCLKHDDKYLSWRVRKHPFLKYDEYKVYQGTELRAYAFVTVFKRTARISDALSENSYAASLLLHTILKDYAKKVGQVLFLGNQRNPMAQDLFNQLQQFGFSVSEIRYFAVKGLTGDQNEQSFDLRNWYITGLWTEGYTY